MNSILSLLLLSLVMAESTARGLAQPLLASERPLSHRFKSRAIFSRALNVRGGQDEVLHADSRTSSTKVSVMAPFASFGAFYAASIESRPIVTKSITACIIFGISDALAQRFERSKEKTSRMNMTRLLTSMAVGLLYFGPAAHAWYDMIFKLLPGTSLVSTLQKAVMGQLIFGPSFTCIFFATSLLQAGDFSPGNWFRKIRRDLPGVWLSGASFWPFVDLISYSFVAPAYIPLFVNVCSLLWTIYLSTVANRK